MKCINIVLSALVIPSSAGVNSLNRIGTDRPNLVPKDIYHREAVVCAANYIKIAVSGG